MLRIAVHQNSDFVNRYSNDKETGEVIVRNELEDVEGSIMIFTDDGHGNGLPLPLNDESRLFIENCINDGLSRLTRTEINEIFFPVWRDLKA